ncbi:hypothetical protein Droror1_Dr00016366 [Drosera rotundifolia]
MLASDFDNSDNGVSATNNGVEVESLRERESGNGGDGDGGGVKRRRRRRDRRGGGGRERRPASPSHVASASPIPATASPHTRCRLPQLLWLHHRLLSWVSETPPPPLPTTPPSPHAPAAPSHFFAGYAVVCCCREVDSTPRTLDFEESASSQAFSAGEKLSPSRFNPKHAQFRNHH